MQCTPPVPRPCEAARRTKTYDRWLQAPAGHLSSCVGPWDGGQVGPECRVCTHSLENGLAGVTPTGRAVDVFKVVEKQVSLSLALRAPAEPGRRSQTRETAEQASAGQVVGRLLCVSAWTCPVNPGPGCRMRSSIGRAWAPAPQGPWSEQLRMDALLDGMRRGHSVPGWAGHRACTGPDPVSTWKGSHTNTQDLCPGLSRWSGLAWAPSARPLHRTRDSEALLLHGPPPTGGEGTSPCPCQLGTGQSKLRGVGTRVWSSLHESYRV